MNAVERVKAMCKKQKIPISKLENDLGFGNAYISSLKNGSFPSERLKPIADYLNTSIEYIATGKKSEVPTPLLSDEYTEIIDLYSKLSKENQTAIMQIMRNLKHKEDKSYE